jgi:hypothetical protein
MLLQKGKIGCSWVENEIETTMKLNTVRGLIPPRGIEREIVIRTKILEDGHSQIERSFGPIWNKLHWNWFENSNEVIASGGSFVNLVKVGSKKWNIDRRISYEKENLCLLLPSIWKTRYKWSFTITISINHNDDHSVNAKWRRCWFELIIFNNSCEITKLYRIVNSLRVKA